MNRTQILSSEDVLGGRLEGGTQGRSREGKGGEASGFRGMWENVTSTGLKQKKEKELEIWEKQGTRKLLWSEQVEEGEGTR